MSEELVVSNRENLKKLLEDRKDRIEALASKYLPAKKVFEVAMVAHSTNPDLFKCTSLSVMQSIMDCVELGLEFSGKRQFAHLIPYGKECTLQIGYRGFLELARRSGKFLKFEARVVYEGESFRMEYGTEPSIRHIPDFDETRPVKCVYAIAYFKGGGTQFAVKSKAEIEKIRAIAQTDKVWSKHWNEQAKKTVLKLLCKLLDQTPEMSQASQVDNDINFPKIIPSEASDIEVEANGERSKKLAGKLKEKETTEEPTDKLKL